MPAKSTLDVTYSCPVQKAKAVYFYAGVKLPGKIYNPYTNDNASPGELGFATGGEKTDVTGGVSLPKKDATVVAKKNGVTIDTKACKKQKKQISLSTKGLPYPESADKKFRGYVYQVCDTAVTRVLFRLQVHSIGGMPTSAVFAMRNANSKGKPIALVNWSPKKVTAHTTIMQRP